MTLVSGPLGSGKTTLLRRLIDATAGRKLAFLMNEFGEIGIDGKIIEGTNIRMTELVGGCVCCSLAGEFEAAIDEIINTVGPEHIVVETTGVAEPDAMAFDIEESLPRVRLDGVVLVADADGLLRFPEIGHTLRSQVESADLILLNKIDLVDAEDKLCRIEARLRDLNADAPILRTRRCEVDHDLLLSLDADARVRSPATHTHQPEFDTFVHQSDRLHDPDGFEAFAGKLAPEVYRAKGFVRMTTGPVLFNYVAGRWEVEPFEHDTTELIFIGAKLESRKPSILAALRACEVDPAEPG